MEGGMLIEQTTLDRLAKMCNGSATKYAWCVFTLDELRRWSLYGQSSNAHKAAPAKEGLDSIRLAAVLGTAF